jgi:polyisoprenyl-phosphate glycosyltransferase
MLPVSIIIPAYNEAKNVGNILEVIAQHPRIFSEVVLVDDGSTDKTAEIAKIVPDVVVVSHPKNLGKGMALRTGYLYANNHIICFLDADLTNLRRGHVLDLIDPVLKGKNQMSIAVFGGGRLLTTLAQRILPSITGQRCLRKCLLDDFTNWDVGLGIEVAINKHLTGVKPSKVVWHGVSHVMKEEKRGVGTGAAQRIIMYAQIIREYLKA